MNIGVLASHDGTTLQSVIDACAGDRVFRAVLEANETESGVSIHLVDSEYHTGPVVRQCKVEVLPTDSLEVLKARIRAEEKEFVVETLAHIARGHIALSGQAG